MRQYVPLKNTNQQWPQICSIIISSLGAFSSGMLFAWPSPSIPILISNSSHINILTIEEVSYFSVIPPVASTCASLFVLILVDILGRKQMLMLVAVSQFLSWILIAGANNIYVIYVSRVLAGVAESLLFGCLPTYVGEISEPHVRGSWGNLVAISIYFGQFMVNLIGAYCSIRTTAIIGACVPIIHIILMFFLPETPYYLIMKNQDDLARTSLKKLRWSWNIDKEFAILKHDVERQLSESGTFKELFSIPINRKALFISVAIRGCQQLSGFAAFVVYTQHIFNQAGTNLPASVCAIIFTSIMVVSNAAFAFVVDKFGRKLLMTFSCGSCFIVHIIVATFFYLDQQLDVNMPNFKWIPLAGMLLYIIFCASGMGIIPTLMLSELFSASIKSKAMCILNICYDLYVLSVSKMYQTLSYNFGMYIPFYIFAFFCFNGAIFSYFCIPETKGKSLEEIQQSIKENKASHQKRTNIEIEFDQKNSE